MYVTRYEISKVVCSRMVMNGNVPQTVYCSGLFLCDLCPAYLLVRTRNYFKLCRDLPGLSLTA